MKKINLILLSSFFLALIISIFISLPLFLIFLKISLGAVVYTLIFRKIDVNQDYLAIVYTALWVHLLGLLYFYEALPFYDKILHFVVPFFITLIVYDYFSRNLKIHKPAIFLSVVGILALFEIYEFFLDFAFGAKSQGVFSSSGYQIIDPLLDTMADLLLGALGSLIFLLSIQKKSVIAKSKK